ncbi:MAG: SpoIIIAH-like family protein [Ruminococcaceae bacterium]|nr:SpoIIIAH-like family protein [Oscillospiraceae bacterium]
MKVVKSTEKPAERSLVSFAETMKEMPKKVSGFLNESRRKNLMIICAVFLVGAAVIINIALFGGKKAVAEKPDDDKQPSSGNTDGGNKEQDTSTDDSAESYFAIATLDRAQAREEALEVLQTIVDSTDAAAEEKTQARENISRIAEEIEMEANVETLIKAKGFADCVAVISNGKANVVVATEASLLPNQLAQIKEILYTRAEILPVNTTIIEKIVTAA